MTKKKSSDTCENQKYIFPYNCKWPVLNRTMFIKRLERGI